MSRRLTWRTVTDNYETYVDQQTKSRERHFPRLLAQLLISLLIAVFANALSDDNISVLVTALSILIGFAFAAMFPIALEGISGLPTPLYAEDRDDIKVIKQLATHFRFNVAYFIPLALASVVTLLVQMLDFNVPVLVTSLIKQLGAWLPYVSTTLSVIGNVLPYALMAFSLFLIQECCYTFYRMCFTALALLRIKEEYVAGRPSP